jgi:hypothetical protein
MAKVEFTGFVQKWGKTNPQHPGWGMRVKEPGSKYVDGKYEPTGAAIWRTVTSTKEAGIDFGRFSEGDLVSVKGYEYPELSEYNGVEQTNIMVKAYEVEPVKKGAGRPSAPVQSTPDDDWGTPSDWKEVENGETPF